MHCSRGRRSPLRRWIPPAQTAPFESTLTGRALDEPVAILASALAVWVLVMTTRIRRRRGWAAHWRETTTPSRDRRANRNGLIAFGLFGLLAVATMDVFPQCPASAVVAGIVFSCLAFRRTVT